MLRLSFRSLLPLTRSDLPQEWTRSLQTALSGHVQYLQQMIYRDLLKDDADVNRYFFDLPTTHARRNPHVFPSPDTNPLKIVNLVDAAKGVHASMFKSTYIEGGELVSEREALRRRADILSELVSPEQLEDPEAEAPPALATLFIVADIDSPEGRDLVKSALQLVVRVQLPQRRIEADTFLLALAGQDPSDSHLPTPQSRS
jgi:UDP-glucose:glycoprotein glucosyltransferase